MASNGDQVNENEIQHRNENEITAFQSNAIDASNGHQIDEKQSTVDTNGDTNALSNKKKRKNTNQTSLNVVSEIDSSSNCVTSDASNIEYRIVKNENKRKKIEIQKQHQPSECVNAAFEKETVSNDDLKNASSVTAQNNIPTDKPPLPPKPKNIKKMSIQTNNCCSCGSSKLRTKFENIHTTTVQKLTTQSEQLRLEISQLKAALASEQNAVRALR